jgi:peptidoglycan hydrolase-like protein with peptidoglycan-binding domain
MKSAKPLLTVLTATILSVPTLGCSQRDWNFEEPRNPSARARDAGTAFISRENIAEAERVLQSQGYNPGTIDGRMDEQTRQALRQFQKFNNVQVTGVLDRPTVAHLAKRGALFTGTLDAMRDDSRSEILR